MYMNGNMNFRIPKLPNVPSDKNLTPSPSFKQGLPHFVICADFPVSASVFSNVIQ